MELESYFQFSETEGIRIRGTRIGIETILEDYLEGASPEEISLRYTSLSLEQAYAAILYYHGHRAEIDAYLRRVWVEEDAIYQRWQAASAQEAAALKQRLAAARKRLEESGVLPLTVPRG